MFTIHLTDAQFFKYLILPTYILLYNRVEYIMLFGVVEVLSHNHKMVAVLNIMRLRTLN
jgi:hypothetical protein